MNSGKPDEKANEQDTAREQAGMDDEPDEW